MSLIDKDLSIWIKTCLHCDYTQEIREESRFSQHRCCNCRNPNTMSEARKIDYFDYVRIKTDFHNKEVRAAREAKNPMKGMKGMKGMKAKKETH